MRSKKTKSLQKSFLNRPSANNFASLKGKRILLCEDNPLNQEIAKAILAEKA
jgi:hypothetical protein